MGTEVALHPWNDGFQWHDHVGPFTVLTDGDAAAFDRDGVVVLHDVLDTDEVATVRQEIDGFEAQVDAFLATAPDERVTIAERGAITFSPHLATRSELLRSFALGPLFTGLCLDLIGPDANLYWDQAVYKKPEKPRRFPWHQDNGYTFVEPQQYLTCWVPLTDATLVNGCPQVARGLHRRGTLQHHWVDPLGFECLEQPADVIVAEAPLGSVVVFSSLTPHLTGPNTTDAVRKAYILQYAPADSLICQGDPASGPPAARLACDQPHHVPVARGGRPA